MARFVFPLQSVLDQREVEERAAQTDLARARLTMATLEIELTRLNDEIGAANDQMRDQHLVGRLDVNLIATHRRFLIAVKHSVTKLAEQIATARLDVEAKQRKLNQAAMARKTIESLRDKQKSRWLADQQRKDLAIADDVGMQIAYQNLQAAAHSGGAV
jgi:flagellar FliJ protein